MLQSQYRSAVREVLGKLLIPFVQKKGVLHNSLSGEPVPFFIPHLEREKSPVRKVESW
jgi:hypothetical protein